MPYEYTSKARQNDKWELPNVEVFQLTAHEAAAQDENMCWDYRKRFPLASMNSRERERMLDAMVEENGITGGWFWWTCLPGCLPDSSAFGPFASYKEALEDVHENYEEDEDEIEEADED